MNKNTLKTASALALALCAVGAQAATNKLVLTGGVSSVDGAAGGGITPWAVIGTNATAGEVGVSAHVSRAVLRDYALTTYGATVGINERVELSLAQQNFDAGPVVGVNGLGFAVTPGQIIKMDVLGLKVRLVGDAILDSDTWMPQISAGLLHKRTEPGSISPVLSALGAKDSGTDLYVSATKLFLAPGILVNGTLRYTKANQNGLLGFGGALGENKATLQPEFSVAYLLSKNLAIGAEYRFMPNNLEKVGNTLPIPRGGLREDDWMDIFVAWAPSKNLSLTAAYLDLGRIGPALVNDRKQRGVYLSAQVAF